MSPSRMGNTYPDHPPIQQKPLLLRHKHRPILLPIHFGLKSRLVQIGIEFLAPFTRIKSFQAVLLQRLHQYRFRHLQSLMQIH